MDFSAETSKRLQNGAQLGAAFRGLYGVTPGAYRRLPPAQRQLPNPPPSL